MDINANARTVAGETWLFEWPGPKYSYPGPTNYRFRHRGRTYLATLEIGLGPYETYAGWQRGAINGCDPRLRQPLTACGVVRKPVNPRGNTLAFTVELGLIALAMTLLMTSGEFDLSVGSVFGFSPVLMWTLFNSGATSLTATCSTALSHASSTRRASSIRAASSTLKT